MAGRGDQVNDTPEIAEGITPEQRKRLVSQLGVAAATRLSFDHASELLSASTAARQAAEEQQSHARRLFNESQTADDLVKMSVELSFIELIEQANASNEDRNDFIHLWLSFKDENGTPGKGLSNEAMPHYLLAYSLKAGDQMIMKDVKYLDLPDRGLLFTATSNPVIINNRGPRLIIDTDGAPQAERPDYHATDNKLDGYNHPVILKIEDLADQLVVGKQNIHEYLKEKYYSMPVVVEAVHNREDEPFIERGFSNLDVDINVYATIQALELDKELERILDFIETRAYFELIDAIGVHPERKQDGIQSDVGIMSKVRTLVTTMHQTAPELFERIYEDVMQQIARKVKSNDSYRFTVLRAARYLQEVHLGKTEEELTPFAPDQDNLESIAIDTERLQQMRQVLQNYPRNQAIQKALATTTFPDDAATEQGTGN